MSVVKKTAMKCALFIICAYASCIIAAPGEIYKTVDKNGVATFTDQPDSQAEVVNLPKENIAIRPIDPSAAKSNTTNATDGKVEYTTFTISSPKDQDTFQNATEIPVSVSITPALQQGDLIEFYLDGAAVDKAANTTSISIPKVRGDREIITRGSHTLSASILNANGEILKTTPPITVFVHFSSTSHKP